LERFLDAMRFPLSLHTTLVRYALKNLLRGRKKYPLVLMLEPTLRCNLACAGCDRIRLQAAESREDLSLDECLQAARESEAPVVTVTGGEPTLYPDLQPLVAGLIRMKRFVYLCTNGLLTDSFIEEFSPDSRLTLNFHLDGMEETHDRITLKPGTFQRAVGNIRRAKEKGFRVSTNTTVYQNTDVKELEDLFELLTTLKVDGTLISPAFCYESVEDGTLFSSRADIRGKFREMEHLFERFPFMSSPIYLDFLLGRREMSCTPWGNPTRNPHGWKSPCYLITDKYVQSFRELMEKTVWDEYGEGKDPRCGNCMVHGGYEATAMRLAFSSPRDLLRLALWNLS
jgi:hopanoid biosynthesis associated radical SAM protein HpnH